jgi:putative sterol carrier protein
MEKEEFQVKVMFYTMLKALEEIQKVDEDFRDDIEDFEATVQWKLVDFRAYQTFKDGKYSFVIDEEIDNPDIIMEIEDINVAKSMLSGELDGTTAYMSGDLKIDGNLQLAIMYGSLSDYIAEYLEPIRPE